MPDIIDDLKHILLSFLFITIIINVSLNKNSIVKMENKFFRFLGNISYGIYMYHMIIIGGVLYISQTFEIQMIQIIILIICSFIYGFGFTILVSYISFIFLEKPFLKLKNKFTKISSGIKIN